MQTSDQSNPQPALSYLQDGVHACVGLVWHDEHSQLRADLEGAATQLLTTVPLFIGGARGFAASAALDALNQAKVGDTAEHQWQDAGLGLAKGLATKSGFEFIGKRNNWNFAAKGVAMGVSFRTLDTGLSRDTFDINGETNIIGGLERTAGSALNPASLVTDVATFGLAHYGFRVGRVGMAALGAQDLTLSPRAANMLTGATFGFTSGALGEVQRQAQSPHHQFDISRIFAQGAGTAFTTSLAAGAGFELTPRTARPFNGYQLGQPRSAPEHMTMDRIVPTAITMDGEDPAKGTDVTKLPPPRGGSAFFTAESVSLIPELQDVYQRGLAGLLKIQVARPNGLWQGSGVVVDRSGLALTNFHVIARTRERTAVAPDGTRYDVSVEKTDPGLDLALIRLRLRRSGAGRTETSISDQLAPVTLSQAPLQTGEKLFAIGYPADDADGRAQLSYGRFSRFGPTSGPDGRSRFLRPNERFARSWVDLKPGFSGGPLLTEKGDVAGLNFAATYYAKMTESYSIPSEAIRRFLESKNSADYSKFAPLLRDGCRPPANFLDTGDPAHLARLFEAANRGVVQIMRTGGTIRGARPEFATAFAVSPYHLVTDADAVGDVSSAVTVTHNGTLQDLLYVLKKYPDYGIAILKADQRAPLNLQPLPLAPDRSVLPGDTIFSFGYHQDQAQMTASPGQFKEYLDQLPTPKIAAYIPAAAGYVGAPVIDHAGQVIGMIPSFPIFGENKVSAETIGALLHHARVLS